MLVDQACTLSDADGDVENAAEFENFGHSEDDECPWIVGDGGYILAHGGKAFVDDDNRPVDLADDPLGKHGGVGIIGNTGADGDGIGFFAELQDTAQGFAAK